MLHLVQGNSDWCQMLRPLWWVPTETDSDFLDVVSHRTELAKMLGWQLDLSLIDAMQAAALGCVMQLNGSMLKEMADE